MRSTAICVAIMLFTFLGQQPAKEDPDARPDPAYFRYARAIRPPFKSTGAASQCAVLDPAVFEHASAELADLRLYSTGPSGARETEQPFVLTASQSTLEPPDPARVLNRGRLTNSMRGFLAGSLSFDVAMPARTYTELDLQLAGQNFLATAHVTGLRRANDPNPVLLGTATLFDLSAQHLGGASAIPLPESSFPLLHVVLEVRPAPGAEFTATPEMVVGAEVPPSRESQTPYDTAVAANTFQQRGRESVATLRLPAHVPVERITFTLPPDSRGSFSRTVRVRAHTLTHAAGPNGEPPPRDETLQGVISRVLLPPAPTAKPTLPMPAQVEERSLSIPATLAANLNDPAKVEIAVENGDDRPVDFAGVRLEMRERRICFASAAPAPVTLDYGDPALPPPSYDYARLFNPAAPVDLATLGPEQANPSYRPRPTLARSFTDRHPELLWLALIAVVGVLGFVALRSVKHMPRT